MPKDEKDGKFYVNFNLVTYEGDVYAMGIHYPYSKTQADFIEIHKLSCPREECRWGRIRQEEIKGRYNFLVFSVNDSFSNCV